MPLQVWVQAVAARADDRRGAGPLIYLDESRAFGGALDDADVPAEPLPRGLPRGAGAGGPGSGGGLSLMNAHRLRAPSADGALLAEPPLDRGRRAARRNADRLDRWDHDFQGRRAGRLRAMARRQVLDAGAATTTAASGSTVPDVPDASRPAGRHRPSARAVPPGRLGQELRRRRRSPQAERRRRPEPDRRQRHPQVGRRSASRTATAAASGSAASTSTTGPARSPTKT